MTLGLQTVLLQVLGSVVEMVQAEVEVETAVGGAMEATRQAVVEECIQPVAVECLLE